MELSYDPKICTIYRIKVNATLQLVGVVLNAHMTFHDNLLKLTLPPPPRPYNKLYKVGGTLKLSAAMLGSNKKRTAPDMETSPASETNPTEFVKLEEGNKKMIENTCAELAGPD